MASCSSLFILFSSVLCCNSLPVNDAMNELHEAVSEFLMQIPFSVPVTGNYLSWLTKKEFIVHFITETAHSKYHKLRRVIIHSFIQKNKSPTVCDLWLVSSSLWQYFLALSNICWKKKKALDCFCCFQCITAVHFYYCKKESFLIGTWHLVFTVKTLRDCQTLAIRFNREIW